MAITTAYSFRLKAVMVGDAIVLASLYTIRIWIGAIAIGVALSFWLLLFSVFVFLSLAYLKRYVELSSVERRVGKRCVVACRFRWSALHQNKHKQNIHSQ